MTRLIWFRSDLRVADNPALFEACSSGEPVAALFLVADEQWRDHGLGPNRVAFIRANLESLDKDLNRLGIPLRVDHAPRFADAPGAIIAAAAACGAGAVSFNAEYPLHEARRDQAVLDACRRSGLECTVHHGDVLTPPGAILKDDGAPYSVYSAFKRRWLQRIAPGELETLPEPAPQPGLPVESYATVEALGRMPSIPEHPDWPAGAAAARRRLDGFLDSHIHDYSSMRDFPARNRTSRLSPYLAAGVISVRTCYTAASELADGEGIQSWQNELLWREFYRHVVHLYPQVSKGRAFRTPLNDLPWRHAPDDLNRWKAGETGFPLVDAGMRQLAQTGFMHNRLRMVTAMFLTKHLLIDWHEGERHFLQYLRDADFPSNNGGWQWSASTGTDAAPYFRIFNPDSQAKKFDPGHSFVRQFVRELGDPNRGSYPEPMVDHRQARESALACFKRS